MAGAIDDDTARTLASGRETAGAMLSSAQSHLKKVFVVFLVGLLLTIWALRAFVWDMLKEDVLYSQMDAATREATSVIAVTPFDVILLQVKIGLVVGVIFALPVLVWYSRGALQARGFWPAEHIPRWQLSLLGAIILGLFAAGILYAYELFFPLMFSFLAENAANAGFSPTYSIVKWTEFIVFLMLSFGLAAQLPLAMSGLAATRVVAYETFRDKWRYAVLGIFVFGAMFSPPDPFTQIMWALPLITLYIISLGVTKLVVLSQRAGRHVSTGAVVRDRWNLLAGAVLVGGVAVYAYLTRGGLDATNDLLDLIGSAYRFPDAADLGVAGLGPTATAGAIAAVGALLVGGVALFYLRIKELEKVPTTERGRPGAGLDPDAASAGDPAEIDLAGLSAPGVRAAPPEAFAGMTEDEAVEHAGQALDEDDAAKAEAILDRFDEVAEMDLEVTDEESEDDDSNPVTSTAAGMMDAFTEDETTEDDIGGYYYDIAFILDSLTSKAIWIVATFMIVLAGSFVYLYSGGIRDIKNSFLGSMPASLADQVDIVTLHPVEALIFEIKFSTLLAAVSVLPIVLYFAWPAIEERGITTGNRNVLLVWGGTLFVTLVGGTLLGFFFIAPTIISALALDALTSNMVIAYRINSFGWLVVFTTVGVGVFTEVPVTMWLFDRGGIVSYETMRKHWRVAVLAFFAVGGFLSPKGVFTMFLLALPAAFAYGIGLFVLGAPRKLRALLGR